MGWVCTKDGKSNADSLDTCPVCGAARPCRVALAGCAGVIEARLATDIGGALLAEVVGDEARFCANPQYRLAIDEDNRWRVVAFGETRNATVVNRVVVPDSGVVLKAGDEIAVASRTDPAKVAAVVKVDLLPIK